MNVVARAGSTLLLGILIAACVVPAPALADTQTNQTVRIMAANLNGDNQTYLPFALRIFEGLKPDVVAIQEFKYNNNTPADFRAMLDSAFGTDFVYFREDYTGGGDIPNGIISRWPILTGGSWVDPVVSNRGFAWAQIDLPGTNDLYVVSVHLLSSGSAGDRNTEATSIKNRILTDFPPGAWIVVAGDFNTDGRSEAAVTTFKTFLSDNPIPSDQDGNPNTSKPRSKPYDYVLPSFSFATNLVAVTISNQSFANGLVFDSRVYSPLSDVAPVQSADSGLAQHMAVLKNFQITVSLTNSFTNAPAITALPQSQTVNLGSNATLTVVATGAEPLAYQWRFNGTELGAATTSAYAINNAQLAHAGSYTVVVTNSLGSVTSAPAAVLTVYAGPVIATQPQGQTVAAGQDAPFSVSVTGATPFTYQWRFNGTNLTGATASSFIRTNAQPADAGNYSVVITNRYDAVTSISAALSVTTTQGPVIAQWNFNDSNASLTAPLPSTGTGTASLLLINTPTWASGSTTDTASPNNAWNTTPYPATSTGNKTAGVQFNVSTVGKQNISIRWDQRASSTGSKYARLQYCTNGTAFYDYPTAVSVAGTTFEAKTNDLSSLAGVNNNPNFAFRIVTEFQSTATGSGSGAYIGASGTYATSGTLRFDMVTVSGTTTPPATPPDITTHPQNRAVNQGGTASFSVVASSASPMTYQWRFNSGDLSGATASTYTRTNVQPGDMGAYSVLVTNAAGTATSSNATLSLVVPPPTLLMQSAEVIQWQGLSNLTYTVQVTTNLDETNWVTLGTASSPESNVSFTNQADAPQRFYRVVYP